MRTLSPRITPVERKVYAFGTSTDNQDVSDYVEQAIKLGFSHIDTAQCPSRPRCCHPCSDVILPVYRTEQYVGRAIKDSGLSRSELFITTKYSGIGTVRFALTDSLNKVLPVVCQTMLGH